MKHKLGAPVVLLDRAGIFVIVGYDSITDLVSVKSAVGGVYLETQENNIKSVSDEVISHIRDEVLESAPPQSLGVYKISPYTPEEEIEAKSRERIIKQLIHDKDLEKAKRLLELQAVMVRKLRRKYRANPSWESMVPGKPGRKKGATRFPNEVEELIERIAQADYTGPGANEELVIDSIKALCRTNSWEVPSKSTLRRRLRIILTVRDRIAIKEGAEAAQDKCNSFAFGMVATAPLDIAEADGSPCDIHLKCKLTEVVLGRPNILLVKDKYTKSILGFAVYYGAPSRWTLAQAIDMAIKPKDELLKALGLDGWKWYQYGKMSKLLVDGGADLNANTVKAACLRHGVEHQRRKRKQSGGSIERGLGVVNRYFVQTLEGSVPSSGKKPRGKKVEQTSTYYLDDFTKLLVMEICRRHEKSGDDGLTPNQRWLNYYGEHNGEIRTPPRFEDPLAFIIDMYHETIVRVRRDAILTQGLSFELDPIWNKTGESVRVKLDYSNVDNAWVEHDGQWKRIKRKGPDIDYLRPYKDGPISMLAWKAKRANDPPPGELTEIGEMYHMQQRKFKEELQMEARQRGRDTANALQSSIFGAFPELVSAKVSKVIDLIDDDDEEDDDDAVLPLKGEYL